MTEHSEMVERVAGDYLVVKNRSGNEIFFSRNAVAVVEFNASAWWGHKINEDGGWDPIDGAFEVTIMGGRTWVVDRNPLAIRAKAKTPELPIALSLELRGAGIYAVVSGKTVKRQEGK